MRESELGDANSQLARAVRETRGKETNPIMKREAELDDAHWMKHADQSSKKDMAVNPCAYDAMNGHALMYVDESLKKHKEFVLASVMQEGFAHCCALDLWADESLKKSKAVVLPAVVKNGHALEYADESLKKDKAVVLAAVAQNRHALMYADESLKQDQEVVLAATSVVAAAAAAA